MDGYELGDQLFRNPGAQLEVREAWARELKADVVVKIFTRSQVIDAESLIRAAVGLQKTMQINCRLADVAIAWADQAHGVFTVNLIYEKFEKRVDAELLQRDESHLAPSDSPTLRKGRELSHNPMTLMEVYEATMSGATVVIKSYHCADITEVSPFIKESLIQAYVSVDCEQNCKLMDVRLTPGAKGGRDVMILIIMERMVGDLRQELEQRQKTSRPFSEQELLRILCDVSRGLCHAKDLGVAHRDVKPENTLVSSTGGFKLADFGAAWVRMKTTNARTAVGTRFYLSPEVKMAFFEPGHVYDPFKSDVYSLGVMMLELAKLAMPASVDSAKEEVITAAVHEEVSSLTYSDEFKRLMIGMLHFAPARRLSTENVAAEAEALMTPGAVHTTVSRVSHPPTQPSAISATARTAKPVASHAANATRARADLSANSTAPDLSEFAETSAPKLARLSSQHVRFFDLQECTWSSPINIDRSIRCDTWSSYAFIDNSTLASVGTCKC